MTSYNYLNEECVNTLKNEYILFKNNKDASLEEIRTFVQKIPEFNRQIKEHRERHQRMEWFRKSDLKRELMEKMFHPNNMYRFADWGFDEEV